MCCCICYYSQKVKGKVLQAGIIAAAEGEVLRRLVYLETVMPTVPRLEMNHPSRRPQQNTSFQSQRFATVTR